MMHIVPNETLVHTAFHSTKIIKNTSRIKSAHARGISNLTLTSGSMTSKPSSPRLTSGDAGNESNSGLRILQNNLEIKQERIEASEKIVCSVEEDGSVNLSFSNKENTQNKERSSHGFRSNGASPHEERSNGNSHYNNNNNNEVIQPDSQGFFLKKSKSKYHISHACKRYAWVWLFVYLYRAFY